MGKHQHNHDEQDIAQEKYKGPNAIAAGAGEGFVAHFVWGIAGLLGVGALGMFFPTQANKIIGFVREKACNLEAAAPKIDASVNGMKRAGGRFLTTIFGQGDKCGPIDMVAPNLAPEVAKQLKHWQEERQHGIGLWLANHTVGLIPPVKTWISDMLSQHPRAGTAITAGSLSGFFGYVILPMILFPFGIKRGRDGAKQFERVKEALVNTRDENSMLRHKYADAKLQIEELKAKSNPTSTLRVADDNPMTAPVEQSPEPEPQTPAKTKAAPEAATQWGDKMAQNRSAEAQHAAAI